jgi:hypothetical protein
MPPVIHLAETERAIITAIIQDAIDTGLIASVHDGHGWAVKHSQDQAAIIAAIGATDETMLRFRDPSQWPDHRHGPVAGSVLLTHGNGPDIISSYTDNSATRAVIARALGLAAALPRAV